MVYQEYPQPVNEEKPVAPFSLPPDVASLLANLAQQGKEQQEPHQPNSMARQPHFLGVQQDQMQQQQPLCSTDSVHWDQTDPGMQHIIQSILVCSFTSCDIYFHQDTCTSILSGSRLLSYSVVCLLPFQSGQSIDGLSEEMMNQLKQFLGLPPGSHGTEQGSDFMQTGPDWRGSGPIGGMSNMMGPCGGGAPGMIGPSYGPGSGSMHGQPFRGPQGPPPGMMGSRGPPPRGPGPMRPRGRGGPRGCEYSHVFILTFTTLYSLHGFLFLSFSSYAPVFSS